MKDTVINQAYLYLNDIDISEDESGDILLFQYSEIEDEDDAICISKEKCREVALSICPELGQEKIDFAVGFAEWISSQNYKNHTSNGWSVVNRGAGSCDVKPTYSTEQLIELYKQSLNK